MRTCKTQWTGFTGTDVSILPLDYLRLDLNELLSAVKLRHQHILPISQSGEGHTEPPRSPQMSVGWQLLQEGVLDYLKQAEPRVEDSQRLFPHLPRQI